MSLKIVIIGGGGHARVLSDILTDQGADVAGYVDVKVCQGMPFEYLGNDEDFLKRFQGAEVSLVNGIGSVHLPQVRAEVYQRYKSLGFKFVSVIHPKAVVSKRAVVEDGVQIMAGAVINPGAHLKENVIINTLSGIDHDCIIGAHTHIAPGVTLSGDVKVGASCHIGTGCKIIQGIEIGSHVLVAAGAVVIVNAADHAVVKRMQRTITE